MTTPQPEFEKVLDAFDALVDASESYLAFVKDGVETLRSEGKSEAATATWERQEGWVTGFISFLEDDVLERLRELTDRTAVMETARKGDFV